MIMEIKMISLLVNCDAKTGYEQKARIPTGDQIIGANKWNNSNG